MASPETSAGFSASPCKTITDIKVSGYPTQISEPFRYPLIADLLIFDLQKIGQRDVGGSCFPECPYHLAFSFAVFII